MNRQNLTLRRKLRNYSVLAASAMAAAGTVNAQIVYHPVNVVLTGGGSFAIDLNGDGTNDFDVNQNSAGAKADAKIDFGSSTNTSFPHDRFAAIAGNIMRSGASNSFIFGLPYAYSSGRKIGASNKWFDYANIISSAGGGYRTPVLASNAFRGSKGNWSEVPKKYVALRLSGGEQIHFGWLRLSVGAHGDSVTIYGYAFQSSPDSSIIAGEGFIPTGISDHQLQNVSVYSSGKNIFIKYPGAPDGITITVRDLLGREMQTIQTTDELYEMNLDNAVSGIYAVTVKSGQAEITKKVSIR